MGKRKASEAGIMLNIASKQPGEDTDELLIFRESVEEFKKPSADTDANQEKLDKSYHRSQWTYSAAN